MRPVLYNPVFLCRLIAAHLAAAEIKAFKKEPQIDGYQRLMLARIEFNRLNGRYLSAFCDEQKLVATYERFGMADEAYKLRFESLNRILDHMLEQARMEKPNIAYLSIVASRLKYKLEGFKLKLQSEDSVEIGRKINSLSDAVKEKKGPKPSSDFQILVDSIHLMKWNTTFSY